MTVSDVDRSVEFFSKVLSFEKVSDVEVHGAEFEKLQGVFGLRMRVVRMKLGDEFRPRDSRILLAASAASRVVRAAELVRVERVILAAETQ